jgi:hypothetical protein
VATIAKELEQTESESFATYRLETMQHIDDMASHGATITATPSETERPIEVMGHTGEDSAEMIVPVDHSNKPDTQRDPESSTSTPKPRISARRKWSLLFIFGVAQVIPQSFGAGLDTDIRSILISQDTPVSTSLSALYRTILA